MKSVRLYLIWLYQGATNFFHPVQASKSGIKHFRTYTHTNAYSHPHTNTQAHIHTWLYTPQHNYSSLVAGVDITPCTYNTDCYHDVHTLYMYHILYLFTCEFSNIQIFATGTRMQYLTSAILFETNFYLCLCNMLDINSHSGIIKSRIRNQQMNYGVLLASRD